MSEKVYLVRRTVLAEPKGPDKLKQIGAALKRKRRHHKKWSKPEDAALILQLHFSVTSFSRRSWHAEACLEIPQEGVTHYVSITGGATTRHDALLNVIRQIENSKWFHMFKAEKVYFQVTGEEMEELYRGYL